MATSTTNDDPAVNLRGTMARTHDDLLRVLESFLNGRLAFADLKSEFYDPFMFGIPNALIPPKLARFFGEVAYDWEFTSSRDPQPKEDQEDRLLSQSEFRDRVRELYDQAVRSLTDQAPPPSDESG